VAKMSILIFFSYLLLGCQIYTRGNVFGLGELYEPSQATTYYGRIGLDPLADGIREARRLCAPYSALDEASIQKELTFIGQSIWSFRCYPPQAKSKSSEYPEPSSSKPEAGGYAPEENRDIETLPSNPKVSISEAKIKCAYLGFKPKTEGFGKCVIKLSN